MMVVGMHEIDETKLAGVMAEMEILGAPVIRVIDCRDWYQAIEGCHRLEAANRLEITPEFIVIDCDTMIDCDTLDIQDLSDDEINAGELAGMLYNSKNPSYNF